MKTAVIQLKIRKNSGDSIFRAKELIKKAIALKADFIVLPELFAQMWNLKISKTLSRNSKSEIIKNILDISKNNKCLIVAGSVFEENKNGNPYNTSFVIREGKLIRKYRKIHLFDLNESKNKYSESNYMSAGEKPALISYANENIGISICNDLRYPEMFRSYALNGAFATVVVSAFTHFTGKSHWHLLNRARAVENQMYIISANMCGKNKDGMKFYGHSLIIDPWGKILAEAKGDTDEIIFANINPQIVRLLRTTLPTLKKVRKNYKI